VTKTKPTSLQIGDLVALQITASMMMGNPSREWKGPFPAGTHALVVDVLPATMKNHSSRILLLIEDKVGWFFESELLLVKRD
jgi:hypothetical protein